MKTIDVKGFKRDTLGKKDSKKVRVEGNIPCVLYGGEKPIHFYSNSKDFQKVLFTPNVYLINLDIDGENYKAIVQDTQFHAVTDNIMHVDFLQLSETKAIKMEIPIKVNGFAEGMRKGGKLKINLRRLKVKALPQYLPDYIPVNIDALDLAQSVKVADLQMENIEFLNAKAVPVVTIVITRAAKAAASTGGK